MWYHVNWRYWPVLELLGQRLSTPPSPALLIATAPHGYPISADGVYLLTVEFFLIGHPWRYWLGHHHMVPQLMFSFWGQCFGICICNPALLIISLSFGFRFRAVIEKTVRTCSFGHFSDWLSSPANKSRFLCNCGSWSLWIHTIW